MKMRKCNFCSSNSNGDKFLLKLKPSMLKQLGIKVDVEYYACEDHFENEAITGGKRRRWAEGAKLNVNTSDIELNQDALDGASADHVYARSNQQEIEEDMSQEAVSLKMGEEFFLESQSLTCREETLLDDEVFEETAEADSEVRLIFSCNQCNKTDQGQIYH